MIRYYWLIMTRRDQLNVKSNHIRNRHAHKVAVFTGHPFTKAVLVKFKNVVQNITYQEKTV